MIFNGIEKDYIKVNMGLFRPPTPPIHFNTREKRGGGAVRRNKRFTDMTLTVPITIRTDSHVELLKEDISDWLYHKEPKRLEFKQIPNRYYMAEYEGMELEEKYKYATGEIYFYLSEPYRFGVDKTIDITTTNQTFEVTGQDKTNWYTKAVFGTPSTTYELTGSNGLYVKLNYNFVAGDVLEINYANRSVTLNGIDLAVSIDLRTNWTALPIGYIDLMATQPTTLYYAERFY